MPTPISVKQRYSDRLDALIKQGKGIPRSHHSKQTSMNIISGESTYHNYELPELSEFVSWKTSCIATLDPIVPLNSLLRKDLEQMKDLKNTDVAVNFIIGFISAVKTEIHHGSLDSIRLKIEAEIHADYISQAESLIRDDKSSGSHIAAAVIAGASLKALCDNCSPPESTINDKSRPLGMNALIDALKRRDIINEIDAKQLKSWADLRNDAAHGNFTSFTSQQVELMISGITHFLSRTLQ